LIFSYGRRSLTKSSDKLPALAGIARIYSQKLQDDYLAGLWKECLIPCLFWKVHEARSLSYYCAPSWSWTSLDGSPSIQFLLRSTEPLEEYARLINYQVEVKGNDPFGEIKSGWLSLQAPLQSLFLTGQCSSNENQYPLVRTKEVGTLELKAVFDVENFWETTCEEGPHE
jgi:hypothetical protein